MTIDGRDRLITQHIARFHQLTSHHIHELIFSALSSHTPCDRALRRLTSTGYLARIERRLVGGSKGGSGQFVYQLGRRGFYLFHQGRYQPARAINYHTLAIADVFVMLKQLERAGALAVIGTSTEPDCWVTVERIDLKPDLYVELLRMQDNVKLRLWIEVDMGTEGQRQIRDKFNRYWRAYQDADADEWPEFPRVIFVTVDTERANELAWLLGQGPEAARAIFTITTREGLAERLR